MGSLTDVVFYDAFEKLGLDQSLVRLCLKSLSFIGCHAEAEGKISLLVIIREKATISYHYD